MNLSDSDVDLGQICYRCYVATTVKPRRHFWLKLKKKKKKGGVWGILEEDKTNEKQICWIYEGESLCAESAGKILFCNKSYIKKFFKKKTGTTK